MGLWSAILNWCRQPSNRNERVKSAERDRRHFHFEAMEPRRMLAADPLVVGIVYIEEDFGSDNQGDTFLLTFEGGAADTELTRVVLNGDQRDAGFGVGDMLFDISNSGLGADNSAPFEVVSLDTQDPSASVTASVDDGTSLLTLDFTGFRAGDKLTFTIDVDEVELFDPQETDLTLINDGFDPIASGIEFQGTQFQASFQAPHFQDVSGDGIFINRYDDQLIGTPLDLPLDDANGKRDRTAGTAFPLQQIPKPVTISGHVFVDDNLDLQRQPGELLLADVELQLYQRQGGNFVDTGFTATTDSQGYYEFGSSLNLSPGEYEVREVQPSNYFSVGAIPGDVTGETSSRTAGELVANDPDVITRIELPLGDTNAVNVDFAEAAPAEISGHVYHDQNQDGQFNSIEEGIAGTRIQVIPVNTIGPQSTVEVFTDATGAYQVTGLMPGEYRIVEDQPTGYFDGLDQAGQVGSTTRGVAVNPGDEINSIELFSGDQGVNYDFGEILPGEIRGSVHLTDADGNCVDDPQISPPIENVVIHLLDEQGNFISETTTDANGEYRFTGLTPGNYQVKEFTPAGLIDGPERPGQRNGGTVGLLTGNDHITQLIIGSGQQITDVDFCEHEPASLSGFVFHDVDDDGQREPGEDGIAGTTVRLVDAQGNEVSVTTTDSNGRYEFTGLAAGNYRIEETQPAGWLDGQEQLGTIASSPVGLVSANDNFAEVQLGWGQSGVEYNFGELLAGSIQGRVHADLDGDCIFDTGEAPISGVLIELLDTQGTVVASTTTDIDGNYSFDTVAPGEYTIRETQPDGYFQGGEVVGSHGGSTSQDAIHAVQVGSGQALVEYNFCEVPPAMIMGRVFVDLNQNVQIDSGEPPISGVTVQLYDSQDQLVATTTTDATGKYAFKELRPGTYHVVQQQPPEYIDGGQHPGSNGGDPGQPNQIREIPLQPGDSATEYDFAEILPARISGFVFQDGAPLQTINGELPDNIDEIRDGQRTPDDTPLAGVTLTLVDADTGNPIDGQDLLGGQFPSGPVTTVTDANGRYEFSGLPPGNYAVYQDQPDGLIDYLDTPGTFGGDTVETNSDHFGRSDDALVSIRVEMGDHSEENNFSELRTGSPIPPPPITQLPPPPTPAPSLVSPTAFVPQPNLIVGIPPVTPTIPIYGGSPSPYTWHLSIIDAGYPRGDGSEVPTANLNSNYQLVSSWQTPLNNGRFQAFPQLANGQDGQLGQSMETVFGMEGAIPIAGDFNGDGVHEVGVYVDGRWYIDLNGNGRWDEKDLWALLGDEDDFPVVGDWDGDGKDDIGIYGPQWSGDPRAIAREPGLPDPDNQSQLASPVIRVNSPDTDDDTQSVLKSKEKNVPPTRDDATDGLRVFQRSSDGDTRADLIDHVFRYGPDRSQPVTGDWNGDGIDNIGTFANGVWQLDEDGDGRLTAKDRIVNFGQSGDRPVVGDFNGDGIDEIGVARGPRWIIDANGDRKLTDTDLRFDLGNATGKPVVGDFDGDGRDDPAVYQDGKPPVAREARRE